MKLALAAVLFAEGWGAEAVSALEHWTLGVKQHPGWITGNQWAVDAVRAVLGRTPQTS